MLHWLCQNFTEVCYSLPATARSMNPCVVIVIGILNKHAPWSGTLDLHLTLHWLCQYITDLKRDYFAQCRCDIDVRGVLVGKHWRAATPQRSLGIAPVTHARCWLRFTTFRPDMTYTIKSGWINRKYRNHYDVSRCSYGVSTNPLRFITVLLR